MPGITGIISQVDEHDLLKRMVGKINHFNYSTEYFHNSGFHLGIAHLGYNSSRILVSECKNHVLAFIGEIFSYKEAEGSAIQDAAVLLLDLLIQYPDLSFLSTVNGHFSACYCNLKLKKAVLISDRFGTRPVYYTVNRGRLVFASEVKAVLEDQINKNIDKEAVSHLFHYHHVFGYKTLFTGISQLPEATCLIFENGNIRQCRYWDFPENTEIYVRKRFNKNEINNYVEILENHLDNAMRRTLSTNQDSMLISLSGGLDSRYVAAYAQASGVDPLMAFTMGPDNSEDQLYARRVSDILGIMLKGFEVSPYTLWQDAKKFAYCTDGMSIIHGPVQGFSILESYYRRYKVTVSSQMCDAIFGSTLWRRRIKTLLKKTSFDKESLSILYNIYNLNTDEKLRTIFTKDYYNEIKDSHKEIIHQYLNKGIKRPFHMYFLLMFNEHGRRGTLCGNLMNNLFLETRMPSYDNDLMEFALNLPIALREYQYLYRLVFSRKFPRLADIRREYYNLPIHAPNWQFRLKTLEKKVVTRLQQTPARYVVNRVKRYNRPKYVSHNAWFKNELKQLLGEILFDSRTTSRDIFNRAGLEKLFSDHQKPTTDNSGLLWQVVNLEYFYRSFID
ncbi:MAG: hypothetical protein JW973_09355 [Bacteroidales bacterium]|nr:hypothetical protein [Bacteroidales bacterium]